MALENSSKNNGKNKNTLPETDIETTNECDTVIDDDHFLS
jgi:hypothetical protein